MKILYICPGNTPDYQCDLIFIGLRNILGESITDLNKIEYLYRNYDRPREILYGKGFTYTNTIDDLNIDRTDIESKIRNKYYDRVVYGSIHRNQQYLDLVLSVYSPNEIAFIDGEDLADNYDKRDCVYSVFGKGLYFKRESSTNTNQVLPIQFCLPACKMATSFDKSKTLASIIPGEIRTYSFNTESEYYDEYRRSMFAITTKKCGWDCLRHYEILGNGCIPIFNNLHNDENNSIKNCPVNTMHLFPKGIVQHMTYVYNNNIQLPKNFFDDMCNHLWEYTRDYLTCESYCKKYLLPLIRGGI